MKARINDQGELCIQAEGELEMYALNMWSKEHENIVSRTETGNPNKYLIIDLCYTDLKITKVAK